jgi:hypothetical protein
MKTTTSFTRPAENGLHFACTIHSNVMVDLDTIKPSLMGKCSTYYSLETTNRHNQYKIESEHQLTKQV